MTPLAEGLKKQDRRLAKIARKVRVLSALSWPEAVERRFLEGAERGAPEMPDFKPSPGAPNGWDDELQAVRDTLDTGHPAGAFLDRTAESYQQAVRMLARAGTPEFTALSVRIYGDPRDSLHDEAPTHLVAAEHFIERSACPSLTVPAETLSAEEVAARMRLLLAPFFQDPELPVQVSDTLSAKATAGSTRVRLRSGARFSEMAVGQLFHHEAMVHSATKLNGKRQPVLTCLGLSSPRTTATQEGLATLAELITDTMDLARLRRVALRIRAVAAGIDGADFLQVYEIFREAGQDIAESYHSTQRVFRGGDLRGGVVFTKDIVYLQGMLTAHAFLLKALQAGRPALSRLLFAGRMTLGDALQLEPLVEQGLMVMPKILPDWVRNEAALAAYLTWVGFHERLSLGRLELVDFRDS